MDFSLFDKEHSLLLPAYSKPYSDEIFSSWIVRLAYAHYLKSQTFTKHVFNNKNIWNRDIDRKPTAEIIMAICERTNTGLDEVANCFLSSYEGKLFLKCLTNTNSKWILPLGIYHRTRKKRGLMFCPLCFKNDGEYPYYRKHWRLSFNIVCAECGCYLLDNCSKCKMPVIFFRLDLGHKNNVPDKKMSMCFNCKFDLSSSEVVPAKHVHLNMQIDLNKILLEGKNDSLFFPHLFFDVLYHLCGLINSDRKEGGIVRNKLNLELELDYYPERINNSNIFENLILSDRIKVLTGAKYLTSNWPVNFIQFFKGLNIWSSYLLYEFKEAPFWYSSIVLENFYISNVNRRFIK
jgi:hypothetical protein